MRIAILGSWRVTKRGQGDGDLPVRGSKAEFDKACFELGRELANRQQVIIVGGQSDSTADFHVVRGYVSVVGSRSKQSLIHVFSPAEDPDAYHDLASRYQGLFSFPNSMQRHWGTAHLTQIRDADAVLTIGGASGTYQAGLAAIVARKRLIPIGSFGGAARKLMEDLHVVDVEFASELGVLNGPWNSSATDTVMTLLGVDRNPRLLIIHGHGPDRYELTEWLRSRLGINDLLIMQQEFGSGRTLPEKFEGMAERADGAIAIATPDDVGGIFGSSPEEARARENVWIEVGWIWGRLGRTKLILLCKGSIEIPSDLQGIEYYRYDDSPTQVTESIRAFLAQLRGETSADHR
jgi:Predicted nucleotide-binding protein containing TIR-like domain